MEKEERKTQVFVGKRKIRNMGIKKRKKEAAQSRIIFITGNGAVLKLLNFFTLYAKNRNGRRNRKKKFSSRNRFWTRIKMMRSATLQDRQRERDRDSGNPSLII
jgi:hypothetical protein